MEFNIYPVKAKYVVALKYINEKKPWNVVCDVILAFCYTRVIYVYTNIILDKHKYVIHARILNIAGRTADGNCV